MESCLELSKRFGVVIVGSLSADEVFKYIEEHLPPEARPNFRLYPRSYIHRFRTEEFMQQSDDPRNPAWQQILSENGVKFEVLRSRIGADHRHKQERFSWERLTDFVTDPRVVLVSGGEGQLLYEKPAATSR
jgi:hypothetical protein